MKLDKIRFSMAKSRLSKQDSARDSLVGKQSKSSRRRRDEIRYRSVEYDEKPGLLTKSPSKAKRSFRAAAFHNSARLMKAESSRNRIGSDRQSITTSAKVTISEFSKQRNKELQEIRAFNAKRDSLLHKLKQVERQKSMLSQYRYVMPVCANLAPIKPGG